MVIGQFNIYGRKETLFLINYKVGRYLKKSMNKTASFFMVLLAMVSLLSWGSQAGLRL